jgi:hypothetical protein
MNFLRDRVLEKKAKGIMASGSVPGTHVSAAHLQGEVHMYPRDLRGKDGSAGAAFELDELLKRNR